MIKPYQRRMFRSQFELPARVNPANLTPHFRNLLREENPSWEPWQLMQWRWEERGPLFKFEPVDTKAMDSCHPGASAIARMFHDIKTSAYPLTFRATFRF